MLTNIYHYRTYCTEVWRINKHNLFCSILTNILHQERWGGRTPEQVLLHLPDGGGPQPGHGHAGPAAQVRGPGRPEPRPGRGRPGRRPPGHVQAAGAEGPPGRVANK